jgi:hypothetical protein
MWAMIEKLRMSSEAMSAWLCGQKAPSSTCGDDGA